MMNILLPTDFSENSRNAAAYALQQFKGVACSFHFLHVLPVSDKGLQESYLTPPASVQKNFDELLNWVESLKQQGQHQFSVSYKANYLIEAVRQQVLEKNIDLILMGTKGVTNKEGTVVGKNTSDVMKKVKCPVLAISEKAVYREHKGILFPTDYSIKYTSKMLQTLLRLTHLSKASVKILELQDSVQVSSEEQLFNRNLLQSSFSHSQLALQTFKSSETRAREIFGRNGNIDMIAVAAKDLNICQRLLKGHHSNEIPFIHRLPLLILH